MNPLLAILLGAALVLIQCLIGGTRLLFSFPSYALVGLAAVAALFFVRRPLSKPSTQCVVATVLLAAYVLLRAAFSPQAYLARPDAFMAAACLLVYLLTAYYLQGSRPRIWLVFSLLGVALVHVGVGAAQFRGENGFMLFGFLRGDTSARASGMLICPNHLAGYLEAVGMLMLGLTVWGRFRIGAKLVMGYLAGVCFLGLILTGSRGGYLSVTLGVMVFALLSVWVVGLYNRQALTRTLIIAVATALVLLGSAGYLMNFNHRIHDRLVRISEASKDMRIYNWQATLDQFKQAPLLGTGAGTHLWYGRLYRRPPLQADPVHSHDDYLEMLAEYGIVGEVLALFFLGVHIRFGIRSIRAITLRRLCNSLATYNSDSLALCLGAVCAVLTLAAHSVVDFNMHIPGNALLFAWIFGMIANPGLLKPQPVDSWTSPVTCARIAAALGGVALILAVAARYQGESLTEKARCALRDQLYRECINFTQQAIQADASDPFTYFYQGEAYRLVGTQMQLAPLRAPWFENAAETYHKSLALFPQNENTLVRLGQALDGLQDFDAAQQAYRQALGLDPNLGIIHAYYSAHLKLMGRGAEAQAALAEAKKLGAKNPETVATPEVQSILNFEPDAKPAPAP